MFLHHAEVLLQPAAFDLDGAMQNYAFVVSTVMRSPDARFAYARYRCRQVGAAIYVAIRSLFPKDDSGVVDERGTPELNDMLFDLNNYRGVLGEN